MARLYHAGAEIDAGVPGTQNTGVDGAAVSTVTRDTSVFRSGRASWKCDSTGANLASRINSIPSVTFSAANSPYFVRGYFRATAAPGTASGIMRLGQGANDPYVRFRTDGAIELLVTDLVSGSPSAATIADSSWHRIELSGTIVSTNWTAVELRLDGATVATWSGTQGFLSGIGFGWGVGGSTVSPGANTIVNVDDVALNDSTGAANNSWPGAGAVVLLLPTSDNPRGTNWTNDAAGTTNLFDAVNNMPPVGIADTTGSTGLHQIRNASNTANSDMDFNMTTYTAAGIAAADTINALQQWVITAAPVTTSAKTGQLGIVSNPAVALIDLNDTGTANAFWAGATGGTYGTGWKWSAGTMTNSPSVTLGTNPVARVRQITSSTRIAMVCFMGVYVEYTPAPTGRQPRNSAINHQNPAVLMEGMEQDKRNHLWLPRRKRLWRPQITFPTPAYA